MKQSIGGTIGLHIAFLELQKLTKCHECYLEYSIVLLKLNYLYLLNNSSEEFFLEILFRLSVITSFQAQQKIPYMYVWGCGCCANITTGFPIHIGR